MNRLALLFGGLVIATASRADAVPDCSTLQNPVYLQVGDTQTNLMKSLGRVLRDNTAKPITLVFVTSGSCTNIDAIYNHTAPITANVPVLPSIAEDPTWTLGERRRWPCTLPASGSSPTSATRRCSTASCPSQRGAGHGHGHERPDPGVRDRGARGLSDQTAITVRGGVLRVRLRHGRHDRAVDRRDADVHPHGHEEHAARVGREHRRARRQVVKGIGARQVRGRRSRTIINTQTPEPRSASSAPRSTTRPRHDERRSRSARRASTPRTTRTRRRRRATRRTCATVTTPCGRRRCGWTTSTPARRRRSNDDAHYVIDLIAGQDVTPAPSFELQRHRRRRRPRARLRDGRPALVRRRPAVALRPARELHLPATRATWRRRRCATCSDSIPCAPGTCRDGFCEAQ